MNANAENKYESYSVLRKYSRCSGRGQMASTGVESIFIVSPQMEPVGLLKRQSGLPCVCNTVYISITACTNV